MKALGQPCLLRQLAALYRRNVRQYPEAETVDGMLLLRIDAPLYFANVNPVRESLARHEAKALRAAAEQGQTINFIIIDLAPVIDVDASAIHFFTVRSAVSFDLASSW